jgi:ssDNA-binding Zn-finger/Zn-ribbon topoisomerase 1
MLEKPEIKCPDCGTLMEKLITSNFGGFILKGGSPAIHYREKQHRLKRNEEMARRQKERYGEPAKIRPNIAGVETGTWENAHKIAQEIKPETGIMPETFLPMVEKENKNKLIVKSS